MQAWVFEKKHPRLAHDGVAHDCVARNVVGAGVVCVEAEHRLIEVIPDFVGWWILVWLLALLLLILTLTRSARHGGSRCGSVEIGKPFLERATAVAAKVIPNFDHIVR